ncbi:MAG: hypothetical protein ABH872_05400 [Candidatus Omnitrophota bacterium]
MVKLILFMLSVCFLITGCETVHKGAAQAGKPIGQATKAAGGVTEGAVDGYREQEPYNPYNR